MINTEARRRYKNSPVLYHRVALPNFIHQWTDSWQTEQRPEHRYSSDEAHRHREESSEQEEETVDLQNDSNDRPADQHHKHSSQEEAGGFYFVPLEEESERSLQADDEGQAGHKQDISNGEESFIEK